MAEDFSKSRAPPPAGPRGYEPPPAGWRPGKPSSPLTGERPDSRGPAPPPPRAYPPPGAAGLSFAHALPPGLPLSHLMQHWVPPGPAASRAGLYQLPGTRAGAEELLHQQMEREQRLIAQHRQQQQQQQQQQPSLASREAAEKQQREAEKQQREAEKQQREAAERLRQEEERKKQQQAVSQHFEESMRLMQQKGRLGSAPAGSSAGGGLPGLSAPPPGGRFGDRRPADGSSDPERMIHARIHRLYQSTEPAGQPGKPPEPPRPGYPAQPLPPEYLSPYYDPLKAQMHAAKPPADRHSPYLPTAPPGQPSYKPALPRPTQGRSPVPAETRLPPPPRPMSGHGGERSCSPYLPPAPAPPPPPHRAVYSPNAALAGAGSRPPPPAHGGRRPATPPSQLHQTLDLSVGSRSSAAVQGRESPKRPASTPGLNLGMSPAKRARPEEEEAQQQLQQQQLQQLQQQQQQQLQQQQQQQQQQQRLQQPAPVVVTSRAADEPLSLVATPASRRSASPAPPPAAVLSAPAPALSASAPASGTASPAPADVPAPAPVVKTEPVDTRPATYTHKLKKKWLQRHAGGDAVERPSSSVNGADVPAPPPADLPNGSGARPVVKVSPPTSVKSEPAETPEPVASPAPAAPQGTRSTPPSPPPSLPETKPQPLPTVTVNGGDGDSDDSGNSTPPAKRRPAPRRKPPKKAALEMAPAAVTPPRDAKRQKVSDASDSDSDKGSDDDDTPTRDVRKQDSKSAKKRGRRTKEKPAKTPKRSAAKPEKKEPSPPKKVVESFKRPSISKLKKSGASFVQNQSCCDLSSKLPKCRECRITQGQKNKKLSSCCRFTSFRRLRYTKSGVLTVAGFCDPEQDAEAEDRRLWLPAERGQTPPPPMPAEVARLLLSHASGAFTELVGAEQEAARAHLNTDKTVAWKRVVHGYGEMCDVCETTLFNVHWVCSKCGFAVCADCYRGRAAEGGTPRGGIEPGRDRDRFQWMLCSSRQPHEPQRLMLTQIVTGDALTQLSARVQEARRRAGLAPLGRTAGALANGAHGARHGGEAGGDQEDKRGSPLTLLANVALYDSRKNSDASNSESESEGGDKEVDLSTLRTLLLRTSEAGGQLQEKPNSKDRSRTPADAALAALDENLEKTAAGQPESPADEPTLRHFVRREATRARVPRLAPRVLTTGESQRRYPDVRHGWLCDGRLLRLAEPDAAGALRLFGDQWRRGQPVLCSGVGERLDAALWTPEAFARDFGEEQTETVDCVSGAPLPAQPQRRFWDGFGDSSQRQRDASGQKRVLRLRDWPPGDEFADLLPTRYNDLLTALPVTAYTRRDGRYNLATWLPECFVRPELGPRLHAVYGGAPASAAAAAGGGLRQDVADAVHVLAHVAHGAATGSDDDSDVQQALEDAGCDALTKRRARDERAGVIWHIFHADDADKIRDLLNKVSSERGAEVETDHDPLLSADRYMDAPLRRRLLSEYGVTGYAVLQCQGDAVFVPAGAPYQRRQLRAGISAAVEFVSPENVGISFELTQQQRAAAVSCTASTATSAGTAGAAGAAATTVDGRPSVVVQDDKRQIKNIIYHAMKEAVSKLLQPAGSGDSSPPVGAS